LIIAMFVCLYIITAYILYDMFEDSGVKMS
jgi:hypothetical protein